MGLYNYSNLTSGNDVTAFFRFSNDVTNGFFGPLILLATFCIVFISMKPFYTSDRCLASSIFITTVFAVPLRIVGVINDFWLISCIVLLAGTAVILLVSNN